MSVKANFRRHVLYLERTALRGRTKAIRDIARKSLAAIVLAAAGSK